ncbi:MAG: helix-turn-helix domain-containing protein, partial [Thermodesulfovibrionales bacterium]
DIEKAVREGSFREDLYYRLNVFPITLPPLRDRIEDIPLLVDYFIGKYSAEMKVPQKFISKEAIARLINYDWKGNVRELENTIERAMILCDGNIIGPEHIVLSPGHLQEGLDMVPLNGTLEETSKEAIRIAETKRIKKALSDTKGNKSKAAEILNVSYKTLLTKIKEYGIE